jgi:hypothetical protein
LGKRKGGKRSPHYNKNLAQAPDKKADANAAQWQAKQDIATVIRPEAAAIPKPPPSPPENTSPEKKYRWTNDPGIFWISAAAFIALVAYTVITLFQLFAAREGNFATWEQGRAHLEVADAPDSTIKITTGRDGIATIDGTLCIANQGPSDASKTTVEINLGLDKLARGFEYIDGNIIEGGFIQPDKIAAPPANGSPPAPTCVPFWSRINTGTWMPFNLYGGLIHIRAKVHFTDVYKHVQTDDVEASVLWGEMQSDSFGTQKLERRDMLPSAVRPSQRR